MSEIGKCHSLLVQWLVLIAQVFLNISFIVDACVTSNIINVFAVNAFPRADATLNLVDGIK